MTPPTATVAEEASNDDVLSQSWLTGSLATGTQFEPVVLGRGLYVPAHALEFHLAPLIDEPFESISSRALFAPDEPAPVPSSESTEPLFRTAQWIEPIVERLDELVALPSDWDHHGSPPVDPDDLLSAFRFLRDVMLPSTPPPAVIPISGGGVQLEWHRAGLDVEVSMVERNALELYFCEIASDREWEGPAEAGFAEHNLAERLID